jgi:hypothetical protein
MTSFCRPCPTYAFARFSARELRRRPGALSSSRKFCFCIHIFFVVVVLIDLLFPKKLALSTKQCERRVVELAQVGNIAELE